MNDATAPQSATIIYAILSMVVRLVSAQLNVFNLWYQRRAYERSRGEMITMIYEKTLNRKILGAKEEHPNGQSNRDANAEGNGHAQGELTKTESQTWLSQLLESFRRIYLKKPKATGEERVAASMGKILNLMRNDVYEISQRFWDFSDIFTKPIGALVAVLLIWRMLGWACLLGVIALGAVQLINVGIARLQIHFEKKRRVATDEKLQRTTQFIESIRHLRWYGWELPWLNSILESRQKEMRLRLIMMFFSTLLAFMMRFSSGLFPAIAFYAFTALAGKPLRVDIICT